jgi:hypothetical protein
MNSEQQISQDQTSGEIIKQNLFNPLLILGAIVGIAVVVYRLLQQDEEDFSGNEFPPIIIKSGSFAIETDNDNNGLQLTSNSNPFVYKKMNSAPITGVRVFRYNEINGDKDSDTFNDLVGFQVDIWLEYFENNGWTNITSQPQISIDVNNQDFVLKLRFTNRLKDKKEKKHPIRKAKYEDNEPKIFRFGKVEILKKSNNSIKPYNDEGDDYIIGLYNSVS